MSLTLFEKLGFSPTVITNQTSTYTALATDDQINITGSGVVLNLPALNTFQGLIQYRKIYAIYNNGATYPITVQPGTNASTGVADTIASRVSWVLNPNELIVISGDAAFTDWAISSPQNSQTLLRNNFAIVATTNGTTPVNIFDASGAPDNLNITAIVAIATVTLAGNVVAMNGTNTMITLAKATTIGALTGGAPSSVPAVAKGAVFTVAMGGANEDCNVIIFGNTQTLVEFAN